MADDIIFIRSKKEEMNIKFKYNSEFREFNRVTGDAISKTFQRISLKLSGKKSKATFDFL